VTGAEAIEVRLTAKRFKFEPDRIEVREGERVRLVLHSADVTHGIEIEEFGVALEVPKGGEVVSVEFVADRAGTFRFVCSEYCGAGHRGMKGALVVHPAEREVSE
jgi:cytochrome c oxidase subunit II